MNRKIIVIGAGIGGLTTAALLIRAGFRVTVLEAQTYPGGSAGTFFHKGYRFDAGATLAGGFSSQGPHARLAELLNLEWPVRPVDPAWIVHLPSQTITQWSDANCWQDERRRAFPGSESFWKRQESLAEISWRISSHDFPWPPGNVKNWLSMANSINPSLVRAVPHLWRSVEDLLPRKSSPDLRSFLDAQLIISAQTTAVYANALYGSAALDLPRRGVNNIIGGIGSLSQRLVDWIRAQGGEVHFRQPVNCISLKSNSRYDIQTEKGFTASCDGIVANLSLPAIERLFKVPPQKSLNSNRKNEKLTWGAFTLYLGLDSSQLPVLAADHHQVIVDPTKPLGEGNSIFISLSEPSDSSRAPIGHRAATLSTHTAVMPWWDAYHQDLSLYAHRKEMYIEKVLEAAEVAIPGFRRAIRLCLPGTPVTFADYTRRPFGMVGGYPLTSLFQVRGPFTGHPNLWMVGDSIFPGQSTAGVTLGAFRVVSEIRNSFHSSG